MTTYVNTDASYELGMAALAYTSEALGQDIILTEAKCSGEAELMALCMAMRAADAASLTEVTFRTDSSACAYPQKVRQNRLLPFTEEIIGFMNQNEYWRVVQVPRRRNIQANILARRALRAHQPKPFER